MKSGEDSGKALLSADGEEVVRRRPKEAASSPLTRLSANQQVTTEKVSKALKQKMKTPGESGKLDDFFLLSSLLFSRLPFIGRELFGTRL